MKAVIFKPCVRLGSDSTVILSPTRDLRACCHVISCRALLHIRTCGREEETEEDHARYGHRPSTAKFRVCQPPHLAPCLILAERQAHSTFTGDQFESV